MAPYWSQKTNKKKAPMPRPKPKAKGRGKGRKPPPPPQLQRQPSLGNSQGQKILAQSLNQGRRIGQVPILWKVACADAPTRATQDYNRFLGSWIKETPDPTVNPEPVLPGQYTDECIYLYMPDYAAHQLLCVNTSPNPATSLGALPRAYVDLNHVVIEQSPNLFASSPTFERLALTAASLTISTKYPSSSGQLNIRRYTVKDSTITPKELANSLRSDTVSTYHLPLTGNQRWNMHCGVHDQQLYGTLGRVANATWGYGSLTTLGGLIFSFTNTLTGPSIAQPGIAILAGAQWTQELTATTAHTKDNAPERSTVSAKDLHSHQARLGPFESTVKHPEKASIGVMNSLQHGFEVASSNIEGASGVINAGLGLFEKSVSASAVMSRGIGLATAVLG
jgi:hypothetical protein